MGDQIPLLIRELSPQELKSIKQKIQNLYDEATKFDSDFSEVCFTFHFYKSFNI